MIVYESFAITVLVLTVVTFVIRNSSIFLDSEAIQIGCRMTFLHKGYYVGMWSELLLQYGVAGYLMDVYERQDAFFLLPVSKIVDIG